MSPENNFAIYFTTCKDIKPKRFLGGCSAKPPEAAPERSCALDEGRLWSLHSLSVPPHWAWTVDGGPMRHPDSMGTGC